MKLVVLVITSLLAGSSPAGSAVADEPDIVRDALTVQKTIEAVRGHRYPLYDNMWFYANRGADGKIEPKVREFLRFILSRQAQEEVNRDTIMLPFTAALIVDQRKRLDQ